MAKMNGCNYPHEAMKKSQGTNRATPGTFARNNLAKGGVNARLTKSGGSVKPGGASQGKHHLMPKGK